MSRSEQTSKNWSAWHERLHKALKTNKDLLPSEENLLLSISGGQDSMVLLQLLIDLRRLYKWNLNVWHGDHGWHNESHRFARELENWCLEQDVNFFSTQGSKMETNNEEKARDWRYTNLEDIARRLSLRNPDRPCKKVVTGHTASDRAETLIMNLARGSDLAGISSLGKIRTLKGDIKLIRPLLIFSRQETLEICEEMKLPIWLDPSNQNLNFTRNQIRHNILPILRQIHKGSDIRIASLSERLASYKDDQKIMAQIILKLIKDKETHGLSLTKLREIPHSVRRVLIATWLKKLNTSNLRTSLIEEINNKVAKDNYRGSINLSKGHEVIWEKETIRIVKTVN